MLVGSMDWRKAGRKGCESARWRETRSSTETNTSGGPIPRLFHANPYAFNSTPIPNTWARACPPFLTRCVSIAIPVAASRANSTPPFSNPTISCVMLLGPRERRERAARTRQPCCWRRGGIETATAWASSTRSLTPNMARRDATTSHAARAWIRFVSSRAAASWSLHHCATSSLDVESTLSPVSIALPTLARFSLIERSWSCIVSNRFPSSTAALFSALNTLILPQPRTRAIVIRPRSIVSSSVIRPSPVGCSGEGSEVGDGVYSIPLDGGCNAFNNSLNTTIHP